MPEDPSIRKEKEIKIALVAGEKSGDQLGASLIESLRNDFPYAKFLGVGGPLMKKQGLESFFEMDKISVMGLIDPLLKLPELLTLRKKLKKNLTREKPDIFVGIDSPDFNLNLAKYLKHKLNIKTVQYVGPSIWAWRKNRIRTIEQSVNKVLTLFPFESSAYQDSSVSVTYVGHPLAYKFSPSLRKKDYKLKYGISENKKIIALLPGSRKGEVKRVAKVMIDFAKKVQELHKEYKFLMPLAKKDHRELIGDISEIDWIEFSYENAQAVLSYADLAIVTSGTASLEALLLRTPCIVVYKTSWISYILIKPLLNISYFSLPNLLANKPLVPELLQNEVTSEALFKTFTKFTKEDTKLCLKEFDSIHKILKGGGSEKASKAILDLLKC